MLDMNNIISLVGTYKANGTCGLFTVFMYKNAQIFEKHFKAELFHGSFNINLLTLSFSQENIKQLLKNLDDKKPEPDIIISKKELTKGLTEEEKQKLMPAYIGNGHAWECNLYPKNSSIPISCWIFRRVGSGVNYGIEIIAKEKLAEKWKLKHGDKVKVIFNHLRS